MSKGWTIADLAARSAVCHSIISRVESGQRGLGLESAYALACALGTTLESMLEAKPWPIK
jgi:transcriptional regulator with XRE-family HTH domain